jgi:hypothetical protein
MSTEGKVTFTGLASREGGPSGQGGWLLTLSNKAQDGL